MAVFTLECVIYYPGAALAGLGFGLSLIIAIGAQNAFVLRQGIRREHVFAIALFLLNGFAVRFTMGAFALRIDGAAVLVGCGTGLALGLIGALPPAFKALRAPIAQSIKAF